MIPEQYLLVGLVLLAVAVVLDISLGLAGLRFYFHLGIPIGRFEGVISSNELATSIQGGAGTSKFMTRNIGSQEVGFRYRFLGNWDAALVKGVVTLLQDRRCRVTVSLNWYVLFAIAMAVLTSIHFARPIEVLLFILFAALLAGKQYRDARKLISDSN